MLHKPNQDNLSNQDMTINVSKSQVHIEDMHRGIVICGNPISPKVNQTLASLLDPLIKKNHSLCIYDSHYPLLATELSKLISDEQDSRQTSTDRAPSYHLLDLDNAGHSIRINPIHPDRIKSLREAHRLAEMLTQCMTVPQVTGMYCFGYFEQAATRVLSAAIYYLVKYEPDLADLPHVFCFLIDNTDKLSLLDTMMEDVELRQYLSVFKPAMENRDKSQLEAMIGELCVRLAYMMSIEACWIFSGDTLPEKILNTAPGNTQRLVIASHPAQTDLRPWAYIPWFNFMVSYMTDYFTHGHQLDHAGKAVIIEGMDQLYIPVLPTAIGLARNSRTSLILNPLFKSNLQLRYGFDELGTILQPDSKKTCIKQDKKSFVQSFCDTYEGKNTVTFKKKLKNNYCRILNETRKLMAKRGKRQL